MRSAATCLRIRDLRDAVARLCNTYTQHLQFYICEMGEYGGPIRMEAFEDMMIDRGLYDDDMPPVDEKLAQELLIFSCSKDEFVTQKFSEEQTDNMTRIWLLMQNRADACRIEIGLLDQFYRVGKSGMKNELPLPQTLAHVEGVPFGTEGLHYSLIEYDEARGRINANAPRPT